MFLIDQTHLRNVLLRHLRPEDFALLAPHLTAVELPRDDVLAEPGQPFTQALFPERGIISMVIVSPEGQKTESGIVGRDGFWAPGLALGAQRSTHLVNVQVSGEGHRISVDALREVIAESRPLHELLLRYAHALSIQTAYTAMSNAVHPIDERLARWLLMCHDRTGHEMALTHEFLSVMLAVRRPSVTTALHVLEGNGFIRTSRGVVTVTNRRGLEEFASDAYGQPEAEYAQLIGPMQQPHPP